jgi:hypothetical protein
MCASAHILFENSGISAHILDNTGAASLVSEAVFRLPPHVSDSMFLGKKKYSEYLATNHTI